MILVVGTGPLDTAQRRPYLDWIHTAGEQGEFVRHLTVWNEQPASIEALLTTTGGRRGPPRRAARCIPDGASTGHPTEPGESREPATSVVDLVPA